ncbi:MAG: HlyD family efflux transporter periplasmic adaptor subunit [Bacteroidales bacterium]|nr:HlyD family efflux transporter periplasmic adaptor subunit [Bacteroidales bacterium]
MNKFIQWNFLGLVVVGFLLAGCHQNSASKATHYLPLPTVTITKPRIENKDVYTSFHGVSRYLQSVHFSAQSTGVVSNVLIQPGDEIKKGQALIVVKPVEISALEKTGTISQQMLNSRDTVFSNQTVLVNQVLVQEGDYIQPGNLLASAFKKNSLSALVYVPFRQVSLIAKNKNCTVEIPGKGSIHSSFGKKLFFADSTTQTQPFVVKLPSSLLLSAGINLRVQYKTGEIKNGLFIPRSALLSDEEETEFWVMKIDHGTTAVKVPVTIGWQGNKIVQILSGNLTQNDRIITEGAYGLPDGTKVQITK